jgi:transcription elongation factor Elf1
MDLAVTFGKHRGDKIGDLVADGDYMNWLVQQLWWPERWEYRVLAAVRNGTPIPDPPKYRPVLEQEYDLAVERPAKVRRVTHRKYSDKSMEFECPNCGANEAQDIPNRVLGLSPHGSTIPTYNSVRCKICGQHATIKVEKRVDGDAWVVLFEAYECPTWSGKSTADYESACSACPQKKGVYGDHTGCGCWRLLECNCK